MSSERFVARQPIFGEREIVAGYELLFRSGPENFFRSDDPDQASRSVVDDMFLFGMDVLTHGRKAFINLTRTLLLEDFVTLLPKDVTIVEILESIEPDDQIIEACRRLRHAGYLLALDDFVPANGHSPLVALVDLIKVDFLQTAPGARQELISRYRPRGITMLAEKVETREDFEAARRWGYQLFQGYFFSRPEMVSRRDIPPFKLNYLRVLRAINEPEMRIAELENVIKVETSLCYRLLRYLNSPVFGFHNEITSIRHALALLGLRLIRKWMSMVTLMALAEDKPAELVVACLVRARFCELMAALAGLRKRRPDLFMTGLLSHLDAILGRPMPEILAELPVSDDVKNALLHGGGPFGTIYQSVVAYEQGEWEKFGELITRTSLDGNLVPEVHLQAVAWANQMFLPG